MKKIYITRKIPDVGIAMLREKEYEIDINPDDRVLTKDELLNALRQKPYDGVISLLTDAINAEVFDAVPTAKIFSNYAVGFNNIDCAEAAKREIVVANTPGASTSAVAEFTVTLTLALMHQIVDADQFIRDGKYQGWNPSIFMGSELPGKTLGLLGAGRIGAEAARMLMTAFGMKIAYYDVQRNEKFEEATGATFYASVDEVLAVADVVSVHVPLLPTTHHLLGAEQFKKMKKTALLVNTSRGPVLDEVALVEALKAGTFAGAALDVFEFEPKISEGLTSLPNVILTPHIASATDVARDTMATMAADNIISFFEGKEVKNKIKV